MQPAPTCVHLLPAIQGGQWGRGETSQEDPLRDWSGRPWVWVGQLEEGLGGRPIEVSQGLRLAHFHPDLGLSPSGQKVLFLN